MIKTKIKLIALGALILSSLIVSLKFIFEDDLDKGRYAFMPITALALSVMLFGDVFEKFKKIKNNP
jgi:hypothetical protein